MMLPTNDAHSVDAPILSLLHIVRQERRASDAQRSTNQRMKRLVHCFLAIMAPTHSQARISFTTSPLTSVSRKSRPA